MQPFWTQFGALSPIDWCEPNYLHSAYVAEWWNTLSSALIVLVGLYGWWTARRPRFALGYVLIAIVGLGSIAFHGTLLKSAQASDELPMILTGLLFVYVYRMRRGVDRLRPYVIAALVAYGVAVFIAYFTLAAYFHFFLFAYAALLTYLSFGTLHLAFREDPRPETKRDFFLSVGAYIGGFVFLWIPEHFLLGCAHPLQALELHAVFHVTSCIGSFCWLRLLQRVSTSAPPRREHRSDTLALGDSAGSVAD